MKIGLSFFVSILLHGVIFWGLKSEGKLIDRIVVRDAAPMQLKGHLVERFIRPRAIQVEINKVRQNPSLEAREANKIIVRSDAELINNPDKADHINPFPDYPEEARANELEGRVLFEVKTGPFGEVASFRLINSSGHEVLDQAAKAALKDWKLGPEQVYSIPFNFELE